LGEGTRFTVHLPLIYAHRDSASLENFFETNNGTQEKKRKFEECLETKSLKILLVEDNAVNQHLLQRLLLKLGHKVTCASDGFEALTLFRDNHYDLILTDAHMPNMNGFEMVRRLHQMGLPEPGIISISGDASETIAAQWRECGVEHQLQKPFTSEQLVLEIQAVLESKQLRLINRIRGPECLACVAH